jgi:hypothetical protein
MEKVKGDRNSEMGIGEAEMEIRNKNYWKLSGDG